MVRSLHSSVHFYAIARVMIISVNRSVWDTACCRYINFTLLKFCIENLMQHLSIECIDWLIFQRIRTNCYQLIFLSSRSDTFSFVITSAILAVILSVHPCIILRVILPIILSVILSVILSAIFPTIHLSFLISFSQLLFCRRASLRRGEHSGRLRQAMLSGQLQPTDVIVGIWNIIIAIIIVKVTW
jgi:hypothetical protein